MHNSQITVKLNLNFSDNNVEISENQILRTIKQILLKPNNIFNVFKQKAEEQTLLDDFRTERVLLNNITNSTSFNSVVFLFDKRIIQSVFINVSSKFSYINSQKPNFNLLLDEFQILKNHLRGQNYDSSFKILMIIPNFNIWIQSLFLILNKLCHSNTNILLIKKHALSNALNYLNEKKFDDENKNQTVLNIKILCFTNLVYRCISLNQYEYAYLIAEKLNQQFLLKIIIGHAKQSKFMGVAYLASNKLEVNYNSLFNLIML